MWRIRSRTRTDNRGKPQYWSEDVGWTWKSSADVYTDAQRESFTALPKDSEWEKVED